jgi:hypothetical protein
MKLDWEVLHEELDRSKLNVEVSPIAIAGRPAVVVIAPVAPMKICDSLRALLLAKDLELGSVVVSNDYLSLRHVILASGCSTATVMEVATLLVQNAALLGPAIIARPQRPLKATNVFASTLLATTD